MMQILTYDPIKTAAVKNGLVNGVKECVVRAADNKSTNFTDAQSFATASAFRGYTVGKKGGNIDSCYSALATAKDTSADSNFEITRYFLFIMVIF